MALVVRLLGPLALLWLIAHSGGCAAARDPGSSNRPVPSAARGAEGGHVTGRVFFQSATGDGAGPGAMPEPVSDAVVYVSNIPPGALPAPTSAPAPSRMRFAGGQLVPPVVALRVGQRLEVIEEGGINHSLHVPPYDRPPRGVSQLEGPRHFSVKFDSPVVLWRVSCDVHASERAYVSVFDHPFFAVSGADGTFRLPQPLPPGRYVLLAAHPRLERVSTVVDVPNGATEVRAILTMHTRLGPTSYPTTRP